MLDYRSLVHHFENGVFLFDCPVIEHMYKDTYEALKTNPNAIESAPQILVMLSSFAAGCYCYYSDP